MEGFLFSLLLLGSGAGVGLASILAAMNFKLSKVSTHVRRYHAMTVTKLGIAVTQGVLTWRLAESRTADVTWAAWMYAAGLIIVTVGMGMQVKDTILELAVKETYRNTSLDAAENERRNGAVEEEQAS